MKKKQQPSSTKPHTSRSAQANNILDAWSGVSTGIIESMLTSDSWSSNYTSNNNITIPSSQNTGTLNISSYDPSFSYTANTFTIPSSSLTDTYTTSTVDTGCVVYTQDGEHTYLSVSDIQKAYTDAEWVRDLQEKAENFPAVAKIYEQLLLALRLTHNTQEEDKNGNN